MTVFVTGSIAHDNMAKYDGSFADLLNAGGSNWQTLNFDFSTLVSRSGGIGATIARGLTLLGIRSALIGAAGADFAEARSRLEQLGIDCSGVLMSTERLTARFDVVTDNAMCQIATFYTGAMAEARHIALESMTSRLGIPDLVVISPNDPAAMVRHTQECRDNGYPFAADPSQQIARMDGPDLRQVVRGARYFFSNDYEASLLRQKTGWSEDDVLSEVTTRITTLGSSGVRVVDSSMGELTVGIVEAREQRDPTGIGDGFRCGFLSAVLRGLTLERCAQLGSLIAARTLETDGAQEWVWDRADGVDRLARAYGRRAATEIDEALADPARQPAHS